jgi:BASS family bile acid:Na+ symporter
MTPMQIVQVAIGLSMALIVLSLGLRCSVREATSLLRTTGLFLRSLLAMGVLFPLCAVLLVMATDLSFPVKVGLIAFAISPIPPILPNKELKLVSKDDYVYGLLVAASVLSMVLIPVLLIPIGALFGRELDVRVSVIALTVVRSILAPLAIGILVRAFWPGVAERLSRPLNVVGNVLLVIACIPVLVFGWHLFLSLMGDGTLLVCTALTILGLLIGHWLGGPREGHRSVLALATVSRHPGVAIAMSNAAFGGDKLIAVAVLLALLVSLVVSLPYFIWRKRRRRHLAEGGNADEKPPSR